MSVSVFVGQSVLIVGMGNTGAEIALDLSENGIEPTISIRNGVHIVPRDLFGLPIQVVATLATTLMPRSVNDAIFPFILDFALGNSSKYGITRPRQGILEQIDKAGKIPVLDIGTAKRIQEGKIKVRPGVSTITADSVIFHDGEKSRFDAIILATGYRPSYPDSWERTKSGVAALCRSTSIRRCFLLAFEIPLPDCFTTYRERPKKLRVISRDLRNA